MDLVLIIIIILAAALLLVFATRRLRKLTRIITKLLLLVVILLVVLGLVVYLDMQELKQTLRTENNAFVLASNTSQLYTGIALAPEKNQSLSFESFRPLGRQELENIKAMLNGSDDSWLNISGKIILIKPEVLDENFSLNVGDELSQEQMLGIIKSSQPYILLANMTKNSYGLSTEQLAQKLEEVYGTKEKLKAMLFTGLLANYFQEMNPGELASDIKEKNIVFWPDSISFKLLRILPLPWETVIKEQP